MKTELDLAPGVHRIEHAYTNCYVVADDEGVTLVDAGFPSTGQAVIECLTAIGRQASGARGWPRPPPPPTPGRHLRPWTGSATWTPDWCCRAMVTPGSRARR